MSFKNRLLFTMVVLSAACLQLEAGRDSELVKSSAAEQCKKKERGAYEISDNHWCCYCSPAYYKVGDCRFGVPTSTICKLCVFDPGDSNNQTYTTKENNETQCSKSPNDSHCGSSMNTKYAPGNRTHPSSCKCKEGFYSSSGLHKHGCNEHSPCTLGFQPARFGTSSSDTKCEICPEGTFSNVSSSTSLCMPFSLCGPDKDIEKPGTNRTDVVCCSGVVTQDAFTETPTTTEAGREYTDIVRSQAPWTSIIIGVVVVCALLFLVPIGYWRYQKFRTKNGGSSRDVVEDGNSKNLQGGENSEMQVFLEKSECDDQSQRKKSTMDLVKNGFIMLKRVSESENCESPPSGEERTKPKNTSQILTTPVDEALDQINKGSAGNCESGNVETQTTKPQNSFMESTGNEDLPHCECPSESFRTRIMKRLKEKGVHYENDEIFKENVSNCLQDHALGYEMLLHLKNRKKSDLILFVRKLLSETEMDDVIENHPDVREVKYQWLLACNKKHGRKLIPEYLLNIECDRIFHDEMLDVLVNKFASKTAS